MNVPISRILPVTKAREKLGDLAVKVKGDDYYVLTKGGKPAAALVDVNYLARLEEERENRYKKTFIDPELVKYTREFSTKEIKAWQKEDQL